MGYQSENVSRMIVGSLVNNLESQLEMHSVLLEALINEGQLPASCSLIELGEVQSVRDFAVKRINELEQNRLQLIGSYRSKNGLDENISLREIIARSDDDQQEQLLDLRNKLLDIITKIKPEGRKNAEIAVARISCFNEVQGAIDKTLSRVSTYSGKGEVTKSKGNYLVRRSI